MSDEIEQLLREISSNKDIIREAQLNIKYLNDKLAQIRTLCQHDYVFDSHERGSHGMEKWYKCTKCSKIQ